MPARRPSTRLSIAVKALEDATERLADVPDSPEARALRAELKDCTFEVRAFALTEPSAAERATLLERILALHLAVMKLARDT